MAVSAKHDEFNHWWPTEGDLVEEPNYSRNGSTGVQCFECHGNKLTLNPMNLSAIHSLP
ncbi:acid-inducible Kdo/WaaP family kinase [Escherichia coli]|nr:acid-inducible Kdo/WaaP family kinase [Escherichia coli]